MKELNNRLDYGLMSKYRTLLMGVAILLIMFCHLDVAQDLHGAEHTRLAGILHTGTVGVDMFLLLSGIGLYYSYTKKRQTYWRFERRRVLRILPYYIVIGGITYFLYDILIMGHSVGKFLQDLFFVTWIREGSTRYWYVLAILVFYLLFPALYRFIHGGKHTFIRISLFCLIWFVVSEKLCQSFDLVNRFRIALERLPVFVVGIYAGKLSADKLEVEKKHVALYLILGFLLFALQKRVIPDQIERYLYYPIRGALAVSIITLTILLMEALERNVPRANAWIVRVLEFFGGLTYELYLLHQSYMILFKSPYQLLAYCLPAFALPTVTAAGIYWAREMLKKRQTA